MRDGSPIGRGIGLKIHTGVGSSPTRPTNTPFWELRSTGLICPGTIGPMTYKKSLRNDPEGSVAEYLECFNQNRRNAMNEDRSTKNDGFYETAWKEGEFEEYVKSESYDWYKFFGRAYPGDTSWTQEINDTEKTKDLVDFCHIVIHPDMTY